MNRRWVWINLVLASILFQMLREIGGIGRADPDPIIEAAYWSGAALAFHWLSAEYRK